MHVHMYAGNLAPILNAVSFAKRKVCFEVLCMAMQYGSLGSSRGMVSCVMYIPTCIGAL